MCRDRADGRPDAALRATISGWQPSHIPTIARTFERRVYVALARIRVPSEAADMMPVGVLAFECCQM